MAQQLRIDVRLPEGHWAGDVTRIHPKATLRIEQHMPLGKGRGTARCWANVPLDETITAHDGIDRLTPLEDGYFNVDISAGGGGYREQMRDLINRFRSDEIPHRLLSTRSTGPRLLTPRQREVFEAASREGYWDVPRRINLTELAGLLSIAKSTLSNQLQRIESAVFHAFTDEIRRQSP